ncbi:hypothetical protein D915_006588 [Fasciola hepatica]|uniref:Coiled-coil domain-containing protein 180 n=1 Tax=Fasciola hepatica TaxID=6192 RepID=A0A4E0R378_FASHE|nr:hypothetical protein D915_006588 [Fasciola hepatica]
MTRVECSASVDLSLTINDDVVSHRQKCKKPLKFLDEVRLRHALANLTAIEESNRLSRRQVAQNQLEQDQKRRLPSIRKLNELQKDREHERETIEVLHLPDPGTFRKLPSFGKSPGNGSPSNHSVQNNSTQNKGEARSEVLERMVSKRRVKHNVGLENWHGALSQIAKDIEIRVIEVCAETAAVLESSWSRQEEAIQFFSKDIEQTSVQSHEVMLSWDQLETEAKQRRAAMDQLEQRLKYLEEERISKIRKEFNGMSDDLNKHSHFSPVELHKLFLDEITCLNAELMNNKRQLTILMKNLQTADLVMQRRFELMWIDHKRRWQQVNIENCIKNFNSSMNSEEMRSPQSIQCLLKQLTETRLKFQQDQQNLLNELGTAMLPTQFTVSVLDEWIDRAGKLCAKCDQDNQTFLQSVYAAYENLAQQCIDQLKSLQKHLVNNQYVDSFEEAGTLLHSRCVPTLGQLQRQFEQNLNYIDQCFSWSADANVHAFAGPIQRFGKMLVKFWQEVGEKPIGQKTQTLQKLLFEARDNGAKEVALKDDVLNEAIDALRQSATEEQVDERLNEVLRLLGHIKSIYDSTRNKLLTVIGQYPSDILDCMENYESACRRFFGVVRISKPDRNTIERFKQGHRQPGSGSGTEELICIRQPERSRSQLDQWIQTAKQPFKLISPETTSNQTIHSNTTRSGTSTIGPGNSASPVNASVDNRRLKIAQQSATPCCWFRSRAREEAVGDLCKPLSPSSTAAVHAVADLERDRQLFFNSLSSQVTASGILGKEVPTNLNEPPVPLVQNTNTSVSRKHTAKPKVNEYDVVMIQTTSDSDPTPVDRLISEMVKTTSITQYESMIHEVKRKARENFLTHFEEWRFKLLDQVQEEVLLRKAEAEAEYELQNRIHEQRIRRSREDVANVRRTELVLHQARIDRHVDHARLLLDDLHTRGVDGINTELDRLQAEMVETLQATIRAKLTTATKSSMLRSLKEAVVSILDTYMNQVREHLRMFRQKLENQTQEIRNSTMALMENLRPFTEGGNFATDEIKRFRTRLNELSAQIVSTEEYISGKLESIECGRQSFTEQQQKLFEQELRFHMVDVTYVENILRSATNTITLIKAEVADSESQKKRLRHELAELDAILNRMSGFVQARKHALQQAMETIIPLLTGFSKADSANNKDVCKEIRRNEVDRGMQHEASTMVIRLLTGLCSNAADRCLFLNCLRTQTEPPDGERTRDGGSISFAITPLGEKRPEAHRMQINMISQPTTSRELVGTSNVTFLSTTHISRPGRSATDDACVRVVQGIMKAQTKFKDHVNDSPQVSAPGIMEPVEQARIIGSADDPIEVNEENTILSVQSISGASAKQGKDKPGRKDRAQSPKVKQAVDRSEKKTKKNSRNRPPKSAAKRCRIESYYEAFGSVPTQMTGRIDAATSSQHSGRQQQAVAISEEKSYIEMTTLLGRVRKICRENLIVTLQMTETYYRQKGLRRPTRPQLIPQSLDEAASALVNQLRKYYADTELYRDNEVRDIQAFLIQLEDACTRIPSLMAEQLVDEIKMDILNALHTCTLRMRNRFDELNALRLKHIRQLHPYLGTPSNKDLLEKLSTDEQKRTDEYLHLAKELHRARRAVVVKYGRRGFSQLGGLTDGLFIRFDRLTCEYDIEELPDKQNEYSVSDMMALNNMNMLPTSAWADSPSDQESSDRPLEITSRGKKTFYAVEPGSWDTPSNSTSPVTMSVPNLPKFRPERVSKDRSSRGMGGRMQIRAGEMHSPVSPGDSNKSQGNQPTYCVVTAKTTRAHISVLESRTSAADELEIFSQSLLKVIDKDYQDTVTNAEAWQEQWKNNLHSMQDLFRSK